MLLKRYFVPGGCIYDPFVGSGTTLVEANVFGSDSIGCDISAFNCLLSQVKTARYPLGELELALRGTLEDARHRISGESAGVTPWLARWYAPQALSELLAYRAASEQLASPHGDVARL